MTIQAFQIPMQPVRPRAVLLFLHGVGANEQAMVPLAQAAPEDCTRIVLRAPFALSPGAFGWYQTQFTPDGPIINEAQARSSLQSLVESIASCRAQYPGAPLFLIGFSQGAILSLLVSLTSPGSIDGAICFGGRFPGEFVKDIQTPQETATPSVLLSHGIEDQVLSVDYAREAKKLLETHRFKVMYREYRARHEINPAMREDAFAWLDMQIKKA
ncbi:MAG: hypothetical protein PW789_17090 [Edaphobacter sp.]|uniref:alpha/beta hydrolase n=1 Tax=Edaphobacter sp. TaxID=1934404 RepID=UPI0023956E6D|nr:hypothetical protein [Edaphobacter sp.]MDE1178292.1 hypothetical protein [Edaphobacter sp.]